MLLDLLVLTVRNPQRRLCAVSVVIWMGSAVSATAEGCELEVQGSLWALWLTDHRPLTRIEPGARAAEHGERLSRDPTRDHLITPAHYVSHCDPSI